MSSVAAVVTYRLMGSKRLSLGNSPINIEVQESDGQVVVIVDYYYTSVMREAAQDIKRLVASWVQVSGSVAIRWIDGGKLGVFFTYTAK